MSFVSVLSEKFLPVIVTVTPFNDWSSASFTIPKTIPSFCGLGDTWGVGKGGKVGVGRGGNVGAGDCVALGDGVGVTATVGVGEGVTAGVDLSIEVG